MASKRKTSKHKSRKSHNSRKSGLWSRLSPKRGSDRHKMKKKCGKKCFLLPSEEKFPICSRGSCRTNCNGLLAAYKRASQYKYSRVKSRAKSLAKRNRCKWAH